MCEPHHSITQFPPDDQGGEITESRLQWGLRGIYDWIKKIGRFFHISKLGSGHSESLEWANTKHLILPRETRYECNWWDRTVHLDGYFKGEEVYREEALECAEGYSRRVSIGDLGQLRRFLEVSMRKSQRAVSYIQTFIDMLVVRPAKDAIVRGLDRIINCSIGRSSFRCVEHRVSARLDSVIKYLMGLTRRREVLHPAWADDASLWIS